MSGLFEPSRFSAFSNASHSYRSSVGSSFQTDRPGSISESGLNAAIALAELGSASQVSPLVTPDPGNTLDTAYRISTLTTSPITLTDAVGNSDLVDYYQFSLASSRNINLSLTGLSGTLSGNVSLQLFNAQGVVLGSSDRPDTADEALNQTLSAGTYYVRVAHIEPTPTPSTPTSPTPVEPVPTPSTPTPPTSTPPTLTSPTPLADTSYTLRLSSTAVMAPSNLLPVEFNLGSLSNVPITNSGTIDRANTADVYRFSLTRAASFSLLVSGLSNDVDVRLIQDANNNGVVDDGEEIARSQRGGTTDETIALGSLAAGSYLAQVYQYSGTTTYSLRVSTSAVASPVDGAGNTLETARNIGPLSQLQTFNDFVGTTDPADFYRFSLTDTNTFSLSLTGLAADADVELLNSQGSVLARSTASDINPETISRALTAGSYYIRVFPYNGSTNYTLSVSASPISLPTGFNPIYGYGLVNAAAAVAQAIAPGTAPFAAVPDRGGNDWNLDQINAPEVWAQGYTGRGVVVAVVDSGVDYTHPDLDGNIWINTREIAGNGIDDDGNGFIDDVRGWDFVQNDNTPMDVDSHGTHVAGTIAAENNGVGATGVAYDAQIMPVRVLDDNGSGSNTAVANGIRYAARNGAAIINLSLGGGISTEIRDAIELATQLGSLVVMASGNESASQPSNPASLADRWGLAVGAVDRTKQVAGFSNQAGFSPLSYVVAPGVSIYSTVPNNDYRSFNGTSMATPHVAGVAALMLSANPNLTPAQLVSILTRTANPNGITT